MENQIVIQGKKISYMPVGSGKPVVLLHGFGEDGSVWENQIEFLKNKYKLIIPDLPGSGKSEIVEDMSMEGLAAVVKNILDEESPEVSSSDIPGRSRVTVIGHSMGGYITLAFAEKYPGILNGFGLFHSSAFADSEEKKIARKKGIDFIRQHGAFDFLQTAIPNLFSSFTKQQNPELITHLLNKAVNFTDAALIAYYEAMMKRPDRTEILKKSRVPVLFIIGEDDTAVPLSDSLKQCHIPERSYIHLLKNCGHMGMSEAKELSNVYLSDFLSDCSV